MAGELANGFEGGTDGTTITTGNSGGDSGDAFNSVAIGSGGTLTFSNERPGHGGLGAKFVYSSSGSSALRWTSSVTAGKTWHQRAYIEIPSAPPATVTGTLMRTTTASFANNIGLVQILDNRVLRLQNSASSTVATGTVPVPIDQKVRVEVKYFSDATNGTLELRLYTDPESTTPAETISASGTNTHGGDIAIVEFGYFNIPTLTWSVYYDSVAASNADWVGPAVSGPTHVRNAGRLMVATF